MDTSGPELINARLDALETQSTQQGVECAVLSERLDALAGSLATVRAAGTTLGADVRELTHDLTALALLAGQIFGEPFRSNAAAIVTKRQTG